MHTHPAVMFNDNTLLEYILQDEIFMGVIGIFECRSPALSLESSSANPQTTRTSQV